MSTKESRAQKLQELKRRAALSEKANKAELLNEVARKQTSARDEIRTTRKRTEAEYLLAEKEAKESGVDYERTRLLKYTAEEVEDWEKHRKKKAKSSDSGFADWDEANLRKHKRAIEKIAPDLEEYKEIKDMLSSHDLYRTANSVEYGSMLDNKPPAEAVEKMSEDIREQVDRRKNHSRRRANDPEDDISYINYKNMRFNKKISRFYDKYTDDIKQNLERGTAL